VERGIIWFNLGLHVYLHKAHHLVYSIFVINSLVHSGKFLLTSLPLRTGLWK